MVHISIVEGNAHLKSLLGWHLQQEGHVTQQFTTIQQMKNSLSHRQPTLAIIDSDLPDGDGIEFCRWLYDLHKCLILVLSARTNEKDVVNALKAGADDYIKKPFGMQEFITRVEVLLRRLRLNSTNNDGVSLDFGALKIDLVQRRVELKENFIDLTPQEFSLLYILTKAQGMPLSRKELLRRAWPDAIDNPRTIDTHVLSLRKKLEIDPRQPNLIQTVRNVGYRLNLDIFNHKIASQSRNNNHYHQTNNHNGNHLIAN